MWLKLTIVSLSLSLNHVHNHCIKCINNGMNFSSLLNSAENSKLCDIAHKSGSMRCVSVALLYHGVNGKWVKVSAGVVTIQKLKNDDKIAICFYNLENYQLMSQNYLYKEMIYTSSANFSYFFGDNKPIGICFSSSLEAADFNHQVQFELNAKDPPRKCIIIENRDFINFNTKNRSKRHIFADKTKGILNSTKTSFSNMKNNFLYKKDESIVGIKFDKTSFTCVQHVGVNSETKQFEVTTNEQKTLDSLLALLGMQCSSQEEKAEAVQLINRISNMDDVQKAIDKKINEESRNQSIAPSEPSANSNGMEPSADPPHSRLPLPTNQTLLPIRPEAVNSKKRPLISNANKRPPPPPISAPSLPPLSPISPPLLPPKPPIALPSIPDPRPLSPPFLPPLSPISPPLLPPKPPIALPSIPHPPPISPPSPNPPASGSVVPQSGLIGAVNNFDMKLLRPQQPIDRKSSDNVDLISSLGDALSKMLSDRRNHLKEDSDSDNEF